MISKLTFVTIESLLPTLFFFIGLRALILLLNRVKSTSASTKGSGGFGGLINRIGRSASAFTFDCFVPLKEVQ